MMDMVPTLIVHAHQASMGQTVSMTSTIVLQLPVKTEAHAMMDMVPTLIVHAHQASKGQTVSMT